MAPTTAPALVVAAVVHAELAVTAPFCSHNGLVARAGERLVLAARGVDPKSLVVPEAGHLALRAGVRVQPARLPRRRAAGLHSWLLYAAEAYAKGAEASPLRRLSTPGAPCARTQAAPLPGFARIEVPLLTHETDGYQACITYQLPPV